MTQIKCTLEYSPHFGCGRAGCFYCDWV
jgi:hypothetical protein